MFFKKQKSETKLPSVSVQGPDRTLYEGLLKDIPLKDSVIIQKSIYFFDDPEPCYIHRGAVRVRLTHELHEELLASGSTTPGPKMCEYADFDTITKCFLQ